MENKEEKTRNRRSSRLTSSRPSSASRATYGKRKRSLEEEEEEEEEVTTPKISKSMKRKRTPEPTDRCTRSKKKMSDLERTSGSGSEEDDLMDDAEKGITINFTFKQFKKYLSTELKKNRRGIAADNDRTMAKIAGDLEKTKTELGKHKKETKVEFQKIQQQLDKLAEGSSGEKEVEELVRKEIDKREKKEPGPKSDEPEKRAYWWSRKCLKLWPVEGENKEEMGKFLELFIRTKLKIPTGVLVDADVADIRRRRVARGHQKSEALVVFADVEARDLVLSLIHI